MGIRSAHPSAAMDHIYDAAVGETKVEISATACNLYGFLVENNGAADVFMQVFNLPAASVTVGTTVADAVYRIPASSNFGKDAQDMALDHLDGGCTIAVTAARTTNGAPAADASVHIWKLSKGS